MKTSISKARTSSSRPCPRCSKLSRRLPKKHPSINKVTPHKCTVPGCTANFTRPSDLVRHQQSIHGPKARCVYGGCWYMTGRLDKMNEHIRKKHGIVGRNLENETLFNKVSGNLFAFDSLHTQNIPNYNWLKTEGSCFQEGFNMDCLGYGLYSPWNMPLDITHSAIPGQQTVDNYGISADEWGHHWQVAI